MQRIPVESSDIVSIGYDEVSRTLEIEFQNDRIYQYKEVDPEVYAQFMRADSYGQFFSTFITRRYRYEKVKKDSTQDMPKSLAFVTGSASKMRELQAACRPFGIKIEQLELPVDEIQSDNAEDVAIKKAKEAYRLAGAGRPVLVNDSFWSILALRGFPGAYMDSVASWFRPEDFLKLMEGKSDRDVVLTQTWVYYDGKRPKIFTQEFRGTIANVPRGKGLSIDQIVFLAGDTKTIAERNSSASPDDAIGAPTPSANPKESAATTFAGWYNMHRRIV